MSDAFSPEHIEKAIQSLKSGWSVIDGKKIKKTFVFDSFKIALKFVDKVADLAEQVQHHPDMHILYNKIVIELSTHDAGGITQKDIDMAKQIDTIA